MNTLNNKRKKESQERIEKTFLDLIQIKEINEITVTDICKITKLNRSTFYSNYIDIYDLADKIRIKLESDVLNLYNEKNDVDINNIFFKLFNHIKENQIFYKTYFKLGYDKTFIIKDYDYLFSRKHYNNFYKSGKYINYHIEFFYAGLNAIILKWLNNGCIESPEDMCEIIKSEYKK